MFFNSNKFKRVYHVTSFVVSVTYQLLSDWVTGPAVSPNQDDGYGILGEISTQRLVSL